MNSPSTSELQIIKISAGEVSIQTDLLAREEPLEIRLTFGTSGKRITKSISVTMRTPGNDAELAVGFLFTEGIIHARQEVKKIHDHEENIIAVELAETIQPALEKLSRNFYTTSSCGVCGKTSIDAVKILTPALSYTNDFIVSGELLSSLPSLLRRTQPVFEQTGGLHASAIFDINGNLEIVREDVGRHNALDKLIGSAFLQNSLPFSNRILLLSGRASFELIQKAAMAGIRMVAAVGAPSTLAVELAEESGITLIGFLRENRFNIYCGEKRVAVVSTSSQYQ
jgi:FdhD protein